MPRAERRNRRDVESKGNSGASGNRITQGCDPKLGVSSYNSGERAVPETFQILHRTLRVPNIWLFHHYQLSSSVCVLWSPQVENAVRLCEVFMKDSISATA